VVAHSIPSTKSFSFDNIDAGLGGGGDEVPHTILYRSTTKPYLTGYNNIFCAVNTLSDLFRPAVICYFVVGSVVGRIDQDGFSEISTKCRDCH
jgi:hypothetical protein